MLGLVNQIKFKLHSLLMKNTNFMLMRSPAIKIDKEKIIYVPIPKVACTSLHALCVDLLGFHLPEGSWKAGVFRGKKFDQYIDITKRDSAISTASYALKNESYWCFAATRNPYDRLVSCYSEKICKNEKTKGFINGISKHFIRFNLFYENMPFSQFVDAVCKIPDNDADPHFRSQHTFITDKNGRVFADFTCDIEELDILTTEISKKIALNISIPHLLKSKRNSWQEYYTLELKQKVYQRFENDFKLLGYEQ